MNDNQGGGGLVVLIGVGLLIYAAVQAIDKMMTAFFAFLIGLVYIALVVVGVIALFWLYRHLTNKQYGQDRREGEIARLEEKKLRAVAQAPEHMKQGISEWYEQRQQALYHVREQSRFDVFVDHVKQLLNIRRSE